MKLPLGGKVIPGDWIAVYYSGMRNPPVGRVADLLHETSATVQFLAGRKLSRTDIQTVEKRFVISKVTVEHDIDKEDIIVPQSSRIKIQKDKVAYLEMCKNQAE